MKTSQEFVVGKHKISFVSSTFINEFKDKEFEPRPIPTFQKLPRSMTDSAIESELKPGLCELGDVLAFIDNPPEECKDGNWNLFYFPAFVVRVRWDGWLGEWRVGAWHRDDYEWVAGPRVFSPATGSGGLGAYSGASETLTLESAITLIKKSGYKIFKEI